MPRRSVESCFMDEHTELLGTTCISPASYTCERREIMNINALRTIRKLTLCRVLVRPIQFNNVVVHKEVETTVGWYMQDVKVYVPWG